MKSLHAAPSQQPSTSTSNDSAGKLTQIAELAKLLLGCYRTGDANDPAVYSGAVIAVLSDYPLDVVREVVDPRAGLPSRSKWLPTVAEIKEACEAIEGPRRRALQWERDAKRQLQERLAIEDQRPRKTYAEHQADLAKHGIHIGNRGSKAPPVNVDAFREANGITQEQWDAIPNAPRCSSADVCGNE